MRALQWSHDLFCHGYRPSLRAISRIADSASGEAWLENFTLQWSHDLSAMDTSLSR